MLHVLPPGFVRVRYYGLLANANRTTRLARCRELLAAGRNRRAAAFVRPGRAGGGASAGLPTLPGRPPAADLSGRPAELVGDPESLTLHLSLGCLPDRRQQLRQPGLRTRRTRHETGPPPRRRSPSVRSCSRGSELGAGLRRVRRGELAAALRSLRPASLTACRSRKNGSPLASRRTRPAVKCGLGRELRLKTRSTAGFAVSSNQVFIPPAP